MVPREYPWKYWFAYDTQAPCSVLSFQLMADLLCASRCDDRRKYGATKNKLGERKKKKKTIRKYIPSSWSCFAAHSEHSAHSVQMVFAAGPDDATCGTGDCDDRELLTLPDDWLALPPAAVARAASMAARCACNRWMTCNCWMCCAPKMWPPSAPPSACCKLAPPSLYPSGGLNAAWSTNSIGGVYLGLWCYAWQSERDGSNGKRRIYNLFMIWKYIQHTEKRNQWTREKRKKRGRLRVSEWEIGRWNMCTNFIDERKQRKANNMKKCGLG